MTVNDSSAFEFKIFHKFFAPGLPAPQDCVIPPLAFISLSTNNANFPYPTRQLLVDCTIRREFKFGFLEEDTPGSDVFLTKPISIPGVNFDNGDFLMVNRVMPGIPMDDNIVTSHSKFLISNNTFGNIIFATTSGSDYWVENGANFHPQRKRMEITTHGGVIIGDMTNAQDIQQEWKGVLHVVRRNNAIPDPNSGPNPNTNPGEGGTCAIVARIEGDQQTPDYVRLLSLGKGDPNRKLNRTTWVMNQAILPTEVFSVLANGQTSIGPHKKVTNHTDYMLSVDGKIVSKEIIVTVKNWADYVFNNDYKLMPIDTLAAFINENNHLPDMPTTNEAMTEGVKLGEMNEKLLKKVEELTLYVIQLKKELDAVKNANAENHEQK